MARKKSDEPQGSAALDINEPRVAIALNMAFAGRYTQAEIAKSCEVSPRTIWTWLHHPDFEAALDEKRKDFAASISHVTYADKARRIVALDEMAESARREYEARPWLKEIRPTPKGDIVNEAFNADAHAAFRGALDDIAKELGQRKNDKDAGQTINVNGGEVVFYMPTPEQPPQE